MVQLQIIKTWKSYSPTEAWTYYDDKQTLNFLCLLDAFTWIKEHYPKGKRFKIYRDRKNGSPFHCGYVIGFREHSDPSNKHLEQHWIEFREITVIDLDKKKG
jgi:hypothetical protein